MEVDADHPVRPRRHHKVRDQLGSDRNPRLVLPVLAAVAEIGDHDRHAGRRSPLGRIHQKKQFQDVVGPGHGRLEDEDIASASVAVDANEDLSVREVVDGYPFRRRAQHVGDLPRKGTVCPSRKQEQRSASGGFVHGREGRMVVSRRFGDSHIM